MAIRPVLHLEDVYGVVNHCNTSISKYLAPPLLTDLTQVNPTSKPANHLRANVLLFAYFCHYVEFQHVPLFLYAKHLSYVCVYIYT